MSFRSQPTVREYSWREILDLAAILAREIRNANFEPTIIVGVLRGGALPALLLSHMLQVRRLYALRASVMTSEVARARRQAPSIEGLEGLPELRQQTVLLVDDVTNTGSTIRAVRQALEANRPGAMVATACLLWDTVPPDELGKLSSCEADFFADQVHAWVSFPWERPNERT